MTTPRFVSMMNKKSFRPTSDQMKQLQASTKAVTGELKLSVFAMQTFDKHTGLGRYVHNGKPYLCARLQPNQQWYIIEEERLDATFE